VAAALPVGSGWLAVGDPLGAVAPVPSVAVGSLVAVPPVGAGVLVGASVAAPDGTSLGGDGVGVWPAASDFTMSTICCS
jgi:hypothetical protein